MFINYLVNNNSLNFGKVQYSSPTIRSNLSEWYLITSKTVGGSSFYVVRDAVTYKFLGELEELVQLVPPIVVITSILLKPAAHVSQVLLTEQTLQFVILEAHEG